jgi:Na+/H+-dicarboxylate symporter
MESPGKLVLRLLGALAPPLVLAAIVNALINADIRGRMAGKLMGLLILNTLVAILIGLAVANVIRPGRHATLRPEPTTTASAGIRDPEERRIVETLEKHGYVPKKGPEKPKSEIEQFLENVPKSIVGPFGDQANVIGVIFIAVAFGMAFRKVADRPIPTLRELVSLAFDSLITVLHWVIDVVPIGIFGVVASIVGTRGFAPFFSLGWFIAAVILALALQGAYYLLRVRFWSWVRPLDLVRGSRDAIVMAFSTASSTATMPVTYSCLRDRVGLRERSASLGSLVGANFNNDGTALYEAMAALFISQLIGQDLTLTQQLSLVFLSVAASVGAAGIPEAGLVTMVMVFRAVHLPTEYIAILFTVDWFLDRCRTAINVMGDMNVSCILDGRTPESRAAELPAAAQPAG